jgi:membrane protease YdiL (CAAX protease family)
MADGETFLQNPIFSQYIFPFLLVFFIIFAVLERTKLFGEGKKQINALTSFVIGLIFVTAIFPKIIVGNLVLFLTVAIVCVFVILLIWGFIFGDKDKFELNNKLKWTLGITAGLAFVVAVVFATGFNVYLESLFANQTSGGTLVTNIIFIVVIAVALALVMRTAKSAK